MLHVSSILLLSLVAVQYSIPPPSAHALTFQLTYDSSISTAPAGFLPAFNNAIQFYQTTFTDPITIKLQVGWGTINNKSLIPGALGESLVNGQAFSNFAGVKSALMSDAKSAVDQTSVFNIAANDPTNGATFVMAYAEAKALGLLAANAPALDGFVGFSSTAPFTFDPNNRAVADENDFIGAAEHEISEVMGRYGMGQNAGTLGRYSPIDVFRYSSPGMLDLVPANGAYFSINGGTTVLHTFNGPNGGDLSDWLKGAIADSYDVGPTLGSEMEVSSEDVTLMDVIGYDAAVPPLSGDYSGNDVVDAADYTVWRDTLGSTTDLRANGDITGASAGKIDQADYTIWKTNFGNHSGAGAGANSPVPEPATLVLLMSAAAGWCFRKGRSG
jgi:PEP-CTERM motif